jgi:site-specific DNA recombinase
MDLRENNTPADLPRRGRRDRRKEILLQRQELDAQTRREINLIVAEFHDRLPRADAKSIGMIYARYSTRFQASIADQVRACLETAAAHKIHVPLDHVCYDQAVSGTKNRRHGLGLAQNLIETGAVTVFIAFATNRLYRKMHRSLRFVEEELVERGIRAIFPMSGVDTADAKRWKTLLNINAMMDEFVRGVNTENIRAAHEGLMERGLVFGTMSFGFTGEPIPGQFTRLKRPRCRIIVDPETGKVVLRIYRWYAEDRVTIDEIVRRLNDDPSIPLPPRCLTGAWSRELVHRILTNPRFRGLWSYGVTKAVWESRKDYSRKLLRDEPLRTIQVEDLRIVPDELWARVQQRLESEPKPVGRKSKDGKRNTRPRMLNGLFRCPTHDRPLYVSGPHGHMMFCKSCKEMTAAKRPLFSLLDREVALRLTCQTLAKLVRGDDSLVGPIIAACRDEVGRVGQPDPAKADQLRKKIQQANSQIKFLQENAGETDDDRRESAESLRQHRRARATDAAELAGIEAARNRPVVVPNEAEVRTLIDRMATILEETAVDPSEEKQGVAREVISLLTGGRIDLEQQGERIKHLGWLRGRIRIRLLSYLASRAVGADVSIEDEELEVVIDYRKPTRPEALAEQVKALYDCGLLIKEIAKQLGETRTIVARALEHWHLSRDLPVPDGRSRRASLDRKHLEPPTYQKLAEPAKELYDQGLLNGEVADRLGCDRNTVTKAIAHWFRSRGLAVPDGRTRRPDLNRPETRPSPRP